MLIALTIMIFLILVVVSLHYNEHARQLVKIKNALEKQNELLEDQNKYSRDYDILEELKKIQFNTNR